MIFTWSPELIKAAGIWQRSSAFALSLANKEAVFLLMQVSINLFQKGNTRLHNFHKLYTWRVTDYLPPDLYMENEHMRLSIQEWIK